MSDWNDIDWRKKLRGPGATELIKAELIAKGWSNEWAEEGARMICGPRRDDDNLLVFHDAQATLGLPWALYPTPVVSLPHPDGKIAE
jgi:hypothetical protein